MDVILWWGFYFWTFYAFLPGFISRMFGFRVFSKGVAEREIALTFDDGPHPVYTPRLLDLLKAHGAHATFFVVGAHAEKHPDIVRRMHEEGHDIGIHNYVHRSNWIMGPVSVRRHVVRTGDIVEHITGMRPRYYRPPWGIVNVFDFIGRGKPQIVLWTALFGDWKLKVGAERLYGKIRRKLQPGAVLLLHDCGDTFGADPDAPANTIEAVGRILEDGKREGLRFVGIGELMRTTELNKERAKAGSRGWNAAPAEGIVSSGSAQSAEAHKPGPFKRVLVAAWMLWEDVFGWLFRLRPIGDGKSFHYRIIRYGGPTLTLEDGGRIAKGDRVMELHFVNKMMLDIGMSSRSEMQIAIRVIQSVKKTLPAAAKELRTIPGGDNVKALYGISMINRGSEGLGFETFALQKGVFAWFTNRYLRMLTAIIHPQGRTRVKAHGERMEPRMLIMPRMKLMQWEKGSYSPARERASKAEIEQGMAAVGAAGYEDANSRPGSEGTGDRA
ncbi:polysaccharide deacetylase family protein [Cohnella hashimotonis]|uniref:Polysaccharide deacetylase family protein n=1 Tax=Cohnella hashimotonis TaxID=2826895 RepID=A0ABT6TIR6_9BACL|nr:polysaccharide deacetylase family protein [Cohnella hashimotonis]MDI4646732.1 polysaccharide deacetylase family protein [Cohnella hashimotonis]